MSSDMNSDVSRDRSLAGLLLALLLALFLPAGAAGAAGTGGIDVSPYPGVLDGKQVTAFHPDVPARGSSTVRYALHNTTDSTASARISAARADRDSAGRFTLEQAGSSGYLEFPDQHVTLTAHEVRIVSLTVHPSKAGRPTGTVYGALGIEVRNGAIVQQAAGGRRSVT